LIKVIIGQKGTGKTRTLINMANSALAESKGEIVFIDGDNRRMIELNHKIRFINAKEFNVNDLKMFYGFLSGMIADNYDIDQIYIDGLFDIVRENVEGIERFMFDIKKLSDKFDIRFFITMNGNPNSVPAFLKEYIA
jgi:energy-coupling factor transporter ATP-binding protein EcfA2